VQAERSAPLHAVAAGKSIQRSTADALRTRGLLHRPVGSVRTELTEAGRRILAQTKGQARG